MTRLTDYPKIHPREAVVQAAKHQLLAALIDAIRPLTDGEALAVISSVLGDYVQGTAKYMIRAERYPDDPDKPGGLV
jgi:hypothetical protein